MKDVYIKDEGDEFSGIIFLSNKAKKLLEKHRLELELFSPIYFNRIDVLNEDVHKVLSWLVSHNLSIDSEITINV